MTTIQQRTDYTFQYNQKLGRHGWLRLTPAYSVKLVKELLPKTTSKALILDPFSGTATTGLVAAEEGLAAQLFDINPFLIWFGNTKCRNYSSEEIEQLRTQVDNLLDKYENLVPEENWIPPLYNIDRWWSKHTLRNLAALRQAIVEQFGEPSGETVNDLVWIAFCRLLMETSSAAFNHVSMSFRDQVPEYEIQHLKQFFLDIVEAIWETTLLPIVGKTSVAYMDARNVQNLAGKYTHVLTSPPYPNRISYIRELRPYMYWTKFLEHAQQAGELDWQAIGGTWGIATSRLEKWKLECTDLPKDLFITYDAIRQSGHKHAELMGQYVLKYFNDMHLHFANLRTSLASPAKLIYIVGNSTFYGVLVPTQHLLAESLKQLGFRNIKNETVRKRNCKKELFEFCLTATNK